MFVECAFGKIVYFLLIRIENFFDSIESCNQEANLSFFFFLFLQKL